MTDLHSSRINQVFRTTTPIAYTTGKHGGTGFYFNYKNSTYLVTNKHVINPDEDRHHEIDIWKRKYTDIDKTERTRIPVEGTTHPSGEDITVIPIDEKYSEVDDETEYSELTGNLAFSSHHIPPKNLKIIGDTSIVAYPEDYFDVGTYFPTRQEISLATPYGVNFQNQPCFLTNGRTYSGTSGGPVVLHCSPWVTVEGTDFDMSKNPRRYLIGVHFEGYVPPPSGSLSELKRESVRETEDMKKDDFNKCLYPSVILETLEEI